MDIYLKNDKEKSTFHFPVNPSEITIDHEKKYTTADIIDIGEVDINDKGTKINEISFEVLLPDIYEPYCRYADIPSTKSVIEKFKKWQDQIDPLRLIITDIGFNELVNISTLNFDIKAEGGNGKYFNFTFRTYRSLNITEINSTLRARQTSTSKKNKYIFRAGEWIVVTASALNVRKGPGTKNRILGVIKKGQSYKIGSVYSKNWVDIYWGKHGGFICTDYVR